MTALLRQWSGPNCRCRYDCCSFLCPQFVIMLNTVDIGQFVRKQRPMDSYNPRINISHNGTALKAGISWTTLFACYFHLLGASGHWWEGIGTNYSYFYIQTEDNRFKYTVVLQTALASQCKLVQRFIKKSSKRSFWWSKSPNSLYQLRNTLRNNNGLL